MGEPSAAAIATARAFLAREAPDPALESDVVAAADRVMQRVGPVMGRWIGTVAHGALLERALGEAAQRQPLLRHLRVDAGHIVDSGADPLPGDASTATEATATFLGTYIDLLGRVVGLDVAMRLMEQALGAPEASPGPDDRTPGQGG